MRALTGFSPLLFIFVQAVLYFLLSSTHFISTPKVSPGLYIPKYPDFNSQNTPKFFLLLPSFGPLKHTTEATYFVTPGKLAKGKYDRKIQTKHPSFSSIYLQCLSLPLRAILALNQGSPVSNCSSQSVQHDGGAIPVNTGICDTDTPLEP